MTHHTLILGNGPCAQAALEERLAQGDQVILATREAHLAFPRPQPAIPGSDLEWLAEARLVSCRRTRAEGLTLDFHRSGSTVSKLVREIIIAEECPWVPQYDACGLAPGQGPVVTLSALEETLNQGSETIAWAEGDQVVFTNGLQRESHPAVTRRVLSAALDLQRNHGIQAYVLTRNLKVAGPGVERLAHQARQAGVVIVKATAQTPAMALRGESVAVTLFDEITAETYTLKARAAVVDERMESGEYLEELAALLELERNPEGFLQAENVHRLPTGTNRGAIRVAGPARGLMSIPAQIADGRIAAAADAPGAAFEPQPGLGLAEIVQGQCVRCLTCYRLCPYRAVALDLRQRVHVHQGECRQCGICAAECPRGAITLAGLRPAEMAALIGELKGEAAPPQVCVFACGRSALPAGELARRLNLPLPEGVKLVRVPCAGALSREHIWAAFAQGARGVLVLTCHVGNCHSQEGNRRSRQRVAHVQDVLAGLGLPSRRLAVHTLAANMGAEFAQRVDEFAAGLQSGEESVSGA